MINYIEICEDDVVKLFNDHFDIKLMYVSFTWRLFT